MQCGVACLTMVCRYFGLDIELDDVGELCFTSKRGTTLLEISTAAGELGLDTIAAKLTIDELAKCPMPCILYWDQHHFVVLYRTDGTRFSISPTQEKVLLSIVVKSLNNIGCRCRSMVSVEA